MRAAPTESEANAAVMKVLAKALCVPKSSVSIHSGAKKARIGGLSVEKVRAILDNQSDI